MAVALLFCDKGEFVMIKVMSENLQLFLQFANCIIILFGFYKFLGKPHSTLEQRVTAIEKRLDNIDTPHGSLAKGNKKFNHLIKGLEIIMRSMMALIEFEQNYCMTEHKEFSDGLKESKKELNNYLSSLGKGLDE